MQDALDAWGAEQSQQSALASVGALVGIFACCSWMLFTHRLCMLRISHYFKANWLHTG